jgi:hypothetical protein
MEDLAVRPAHGGMTMALSENPGEPRIDIAFVVTLMRDHLFLNDLISLRYQRGAARWRGVVERVGDQT